VVATVIVTGIPKDKIKLILHVFRNIINLIHRYNEKFVLTDEQLQHLKDFDSSSRNNRISLILSLQG